MNEWSCTNFSHLVFLCRHFIARNLVTFIDVIWTNWQVDSLFDKQKFDLNEKKNVNVVDDEKNASLRPSFVRSLDQYRWLIKAFLIFIVIGLENSDVHIIDVVKLLRLNPIWSSTRNWNEFSLFSRVVVDVIDQYWLKRQTIAIKLNWNGLSSNSVYIMFRSIKTDR